MTDPLLMLAVKAASLRKEAANPRTLTMRERVQGIRTLPPEEPVEPPTEMPINQPSPVAQRKYGLQLRDIRLPPAVPAIRPQQQQTQVRPQTSPQPQVQLQTQTQPQSDNLETYAVNPARVGITRAITGGMRTAAGNFWNRMLNTYGRRNQQ